MWLPALGAALFIVAGVWWALQPKTPVPAEDPPASAPSASAPAPAGDAGALDLDKALERLKNLRKQQPPK